MGNKFFDQYAILHLASGIFAYFFNISLFWWFIIHGIFEIIENQEQSRAFINKYLFFWPGGKPYSDSLLNSVGDQVFAILGWLLAYFLDYLGMKYNWYTPHLKNINFI